MWHYMREEVREWVYIAQNVCSLFTTLTITVQIQLHCYSPAFTHVIHQN